MVTPNKIFSEVKYLDFDPENPRFYDTFGAADGDARAIKSREDCCGAIPWLL